MYMHYGLLLVLWYKCIFVVDGVSFIASEIIVYMYAFLCLNAMVKIETLFD